MRKRPTCRLRETGRSASGCYGRRSRGCMMGAHDGGKPGCLVVGPLGCCMISDRIGRGRCCEHDVRCLSGACSFQLQG
eukprot:6070241-Prymnesium_polylepis.1